MKPIDSLSDEEWSQLVQRAAALADAPPAWVHAALGLWRGQLPSAAATPARRALAVLRFDSWATTALASGLRSEPSDVRQLVFSAIECDIDLRITPVAGGFALAGQILGADGTGRVELSRDSDPRAEPSSLAARVAELNEFGEFRLDGIGSGHYRLLLRMGSNEIVLAPIEVGAQRGPGL